MKNKMLGCILSLSFAVLSLSGLSSCGDGGSGAPKTYSATEVAGDFDRLEDMGNRFEATDPERATIQQAISLFEDYLGRLQLVYNKYRNPFYLKDDSRTEIVLDLTRFEAVRDEKGTRLTFTQLAKEQYESGIKFVKKVLDYLYQQRTLRGPNYLVKDLPEPDWAEE